MDSIKDMAQTHLHHLEILRKYVYLRLTEDKLLNINESNNRIRISADYDDMHAKQPMKEVSRTNLFPISFL
jgi:hypothetical protein